MSVSEVVSDYFNKLDVAKEAWKYGSGSNKKDLPDHVQVFLGNNK